MTNKANNTAKRLFKSSPIVSITTTTSTRGGKLTCKTIKKRAFGNGHSFTRGTKTFCLNPCFNG